MVFSGHVVVTVKIIVAFTFTILHSHSYLQDPSIKELAEQIRKDIIQPDDRATLAEQYWMYFAHKSLWEYKNCNPPD